MPEEAWVPPQVLENIAGRKRQEEQKLKDEAENLRRRTLGLPHVSESEGSVGRCWYCESDVFDCGPIGIPRRATMEHKIPISRGGRWLNHNTVLSCTECNYFKSTSTAGELLASLFLNTCTVIAEERRIKGIEQVIGRTVSKSRSLSL